MLSPEKLRFVPYDAAFRASCVAIFDSNLPDYVAPHEQELFTSFLDERTCPYYVVTSGGGRVVACGGFAVEENRARFCWGLVHRNHHGQGIGRCMLLARLLLILQDAGPVEVTLDTSQKTCGFFERCGFRSVERVPDGYWPGLDRIEMSLDLTEDALLPIVRKMCLADDCLETNLRIHRPPQQSSPALYEPLAGWWPLVSPIEDYEPEAAWFARTINNTATKPVRDVLELGSGGGNNAFYLKQHFAMTLTDLSPAMLDVSRGVNPECSHVHGDMRALRLGTSFDAVFVHDAITYMASREDLQRAITTARAHLKPGGVAVFAPDWTRESYADMTDRDGHDDSAGRAAHMIEWTRADTADAESYSVYYAFLLRDADSSVQCVTDRHVCGLFSRETWLSLLREAEFDVDVLINEFNREVLVCRC